MRVLAEHNAGTMLGKEGGRRYWCSNHMPAGNTFYICCFLPTSGGDYGSVEDSWFTNTRMYAVRAILTF